ncbi:MAG: MFS transporter [Candidatus Limnocylindrales bacterium]
MSAETFLARLDRSPLNTFHRRLLLLTGLGWLFDALDVLLIGFLLVPIRDELGLDVARTGLVATAGLAGMAAGAAISGRLADRYGRRRVIGATLALFGVGTLLSAAAPSFELLLGARVIAGLGLGGELPVIPTLLAEFAPRDSRGRFGLLLGSFWVTGALAAGLLAVILLPLIGWRGVLVVGAVPAFYAAFLRRALPESPRHLAEQGRVAEADAIVRRVEREGGGALITVAKPVAPPRSGPLRMTDLLSARYARRTALLWILWAGLLVTYYGLFVLLPTLLVDRGLPAAEVNRFFFLSTLAQLPGYWTAAWLVERIGRRWTLIAFFLGAALAAVGFGTTAPGADGGLTALLLFWAAALSFFDLGAWGIVYAYQAELYPTALRATGAGIAVAVGRVAGLAAPVLLLGLVATAGLAVAFDLAAVLLMLLGGAVLLLADETRARSLEELAPAV